MVEFLLESGRTARRMRQKHRRMRVNDVEEFEAKT
jgi:hypothetical protein